MAFVETPPPPFSLLSAPSPLFLRQYKGVPQTLAGANAPFIGTVTGLGAGGGAGLRQGSPNGAEGYVRVIPGSNPSAAGSVVLNFPSTPPTLFVSGEESFGVVSQATVGNAVTISWSGASLKPNKHALIRFEWATAR